LDYLTLKNASFDLNLALRKNTTKQLDENAAMAPINQSINQSIDQSINQSINQPTNQPTNQSINQSNNK